MATEYKNRTVLGSVDIYVKEHTAALSFGTDTEKKAAINAIVSGGVRLGDTKGGATLTYSQNYLEITDDHGRVKEKALQNDAVSLSSASITVSPGMIGYLIDASSVSADGQSVDVGGVSNAKGKTYDLVAHHINAKHGDIFTVLTGVNTSEISTSFKPDDAMNVPINFAGEPMNEKGTLYFQYFAKADEKVITE